MKIPIDRINSVGIRTEMHRDSYQFAEFYGTYRHPLHPDSRDWDIALYCAADTLVWETNGDPVWESESEDFRALAAEYGVDVAAQVREGEEEVC
jgi:hypothetical protein